MTGGARAKTTTICDSLYDKVAVAPSIRAGLVEVAFDPQTSGGLLIAVPRSEVDQIAPIVREEMESAVTLDVPLTVDLKSGDDWESLTPIPSIP